MASRLLALGTVAMLAAAGSVATPGGARLHLFGARDIEQVRSSAGAKFDGALADLSRHAATARPGHAVEDLQAIAPAVRFRQSATDAAPLVLIDAVTLGDPQRLRAALVALGLQRASLYSNDVGGWLPVAQLDAAAARAEVHSIRAAMSRTRTGAALTQGDTVQHSDLLRASDSLNGAGVTVGVLSDSYDCYTAYAQHNVPASGAAGYASNGFLATATTDVSTGDLPASVKVLEEADCLNYGAPVMLPFGDEGRAMLQIVHDVAPDAGLAFYTAENSEADFANGIGKLAASAAAGGGGARVIVDDVGYFDEPFFQDGIVAQAIDAVEAQGVAYFSAAGNDGNLAYDNTAPSFTTQSNSAPNAGEYLLDFDGSGATTLPVTIAPLVPGEYVAVVVEWDQPYVTGAPNSGGATSHIDLCITGASGADSIIDYAGNPAACSGANATGSDPYQIMIIGNPANAGGNSASETLNIAVGLADGTAAPGRVKVALQDNGAGSTINAYATGGATLQGHPGAAGAAAVGAAFYFLTPACGTDPPQLESFSSAGGAPILFDTAGTRLAAPVLRQKPDFVGPDGVNQTFLGFTLASAGVKNGLLNTTISACQNNPSYPNFFGTSAAAPHVAGIAALMLQANPAVTPTQIYDSLRNSALPLASPAPNFDSGYGFVQADAAFALLPQVSPAAPNLSLSASSIAAGGSTTISWSAINATGCTASGAWSGALAASGTQTLQPAAAGTDSYSLSCANGAGASPAATVILAVAAPPGSGGSGGGALDVLTLLGLAGFGVARVLRRTL